MTASFPPGAEQILEKYEFLIWDFDCTLVHLDVDWETLKSKLAALLDCSPQDTLQAMLDRAQQLKKFDSAAQSVSEAEIAGLKLLPAAVELLRPHVQHSCILTNNFSSTVREFFTRANLPPVPFVSRDMVERPKPFPDGLLKLADLWRSKRTLLIGDSDFDRQLAAAVEIDYLPVHFVASD